MRGMAKTTRSTRPSVREAFEAGFRAIDPETLDVRPFRTFYEAYRDMERIGGVPAKRDFDIMKFWPVVPHVMLLEWLPDGDFFYRVVGGHIVQAIGFDATGKRLSALSHLVDTEALNAGFTDVVANVHPQFQRIGGGVFHRDWQAYERMLMPLVDDQGAPRFLLGCVKIDSAVR